jgi:hypothetical protein
MSDPVDPQAFHTLVELAIAPIYEREFVLDRLDKNKLEIWAMTRTFSPPLCS